VSSYQRSGTRFCESLVIPDQRMRSITRYFGALGSSVSGLSVAKKELVPEVYEYMTTSLPLHVNPSGDTSWAEYSTPPAVPPNALPVNGLVHNGATVSAL
jgi:hypothetical protein